MYTQLLFHNRKVTTTEASAKGIGMLCVTVALRDITTATNTDTIVTARTTTHEATWMVTLVPNTMTELAKVLLSQWPSSESDSCSILAKTRATSGVPASEYHIILMLSGSLLLTIGMSLITSLLPNQHCSRH